MLNRLKFDGAVVIVSGGGSGIGRAAALSLAELGAVVVVVGRTAAKLQETRALVAEKGGRCDAFTADLSVEAEVETLRRAVAAKHGVIKGLVNNAGTNLMTSITELSSEQWHRILAIDLDSVFYMCRAFIPLMLPAKNPAIVNVASSFAHIGHARMPVYCAAKGALVSLTRQLAVDYGGKGLRVNSLCPGPTLSPRVKGYIDDGHEDRARLEDKVQLHRLAECEEIGDVAAFLVSDAASYIHGASILADGGQTIE